MSEFIKKYDLINKFVALALAVISWAVVVNIKNPIITVGFDDILINYVSLDMQDDDMYELVIISEEYPIADLKIKGVRTEVAQVSSENIEITCDLSHIREPGEYDVLYSVKLPFSDMEISSKSPEYLTVEIDYIQTKNVPVEVELLGTPALNYSYENVVVQSNVVVSGPSTEVGPISKAHITIDVDGLSSDIDTVSEVILLNKTGEVVESQNIYQSDRILAVELPVYKTVSVPLEVNMVYGEIVNPKAIQDYTLSMNKAYIVGRPEAVNAISSINLGDLYVDDTQYGKSEFVFVLPYLENISYKALTASSATVTVRFTDYTVKTLDVANFMFDKETYSEFNIVDDFITIEIAGSEADFAKLLDEEIFMELQIDAEAMEKVRGSDGKIKAGTYKFEALVQIFSVYEFDIIGEYIVVVEVMEEE